MKANILNYNHIFNWSDIMNEVSSKKLLKRRDILMQQLLKIASCVIRGSIIERYKRCGKKNCKCANGKGHGPKFYISVSRKEKHPDMHYVPQELKEKVQDSISHYRNARDILEEISEINRELFLRREFL